MKKLWIVFSLWLIAPIQLALANDLSPEQIHKCIQATIKVGALDAQGHPVGTGTGTMIDPRGYVLTNFHVVGDVYTGILEHPEGKVLLAMVDSARQSARYNWEGEVVRSDPRLDLALIKISNKRSGEMPSEISFPYIPIGNLDTLDAGSKVWVFGYPSGVRSVNVTSGSVAGFEMNLLDQIAWLRTDAEINPGNSGGLLVNDQGELVGIPTQVRPPDGSSVYETIGFARSASRIPEEWLTDLAAGDIDSYKRRGTFQVQSGKNPSDPMIGDGYVLSDIEHWYYLPPVERPGVITSSHPISMAVLDVTEDVVVLRDNIGSLEIKQSDPEAIMISVIFPMEEVPEKGMDFALTYEVQQPSAFPLPQFTEGQELYRVPEILDFTTVEIEKVLTETKTMENTYVLIYGDVITGAGELRYENYSAQAIEEVWSSWVEQGHLTDQKSVMVLLSLDEQQFRVILSDYWTETYGIGNTQLLAVIQLHFLPEIDKGSDAAIASFLRGLDDFAAKQVASNSGETTAPPVETSSSITLEGTLVDASSGQTMEGYLVIGMEDSNLQSNVEGFMDGSLSEDDFFSQAQIFSIASDGVFSISDFPRGVRYPFALWAKGYRTSYFEVPATVNGEVFNVGNVELVQ